MRDGNRLGLGTFRYLKFPDEQIREFFRCNADFSTLVNHICILAQAPSEPEDSSAKAARVNPDVDTISAELKMPVAAYQTC